VAITITDPRDQIIDALGYVRKSRHHVDCHCGMYQHLWCSPEEKLWCSAVDRLLGNIMRKPQRRTGRT
jgi:hypothetical protein